MSEQAKTQKKTKIGRVFLIVLAILLFLIAFGCLLYPMISNIYISKTQSITRTEYKETVAQMDDDTLTETLEAAYAYNAALTPGAVTESDSASAFSREALLEAAENYRDILDVNGFGLMGYVEVPKISVYLPIFHGTEEESLEHGVGHLLGTSLPVGGESTHTVLTGHSGLAQQIMFSDLDKLEEGDVFYIHVLNQTMAYEVDEIHVVLPEDTTYLRVIRGEDHCTLVTCTPYGINTHRLLVRGTRIPYEEAEQIVTTSAEEDEPIKSTWTTQYIRGIIVALVSLILLILLILLLVFLWKKIVLGPESRPEKPENFESDGEEGASR